MPENFEDEEIDEDTAFTAEDYERYGDVGTKRKRSVRAADDGYDEDDDDDDDNGDEDDDERFQNLSDLLDDNDDDAAKSSHRVKRRKTHHDDGDDGDEDEDDDNAAGLLDSDDDDDDDDGDSSGSSDEQKHQLLLQALQLATKGKQQVKKRSLPEATETTAESEYGVRASSSTGASAAPGAGVDINDLLVSLDDTAAYGHLKKQLARLTTKKTRTLAALCKHVLHSTATIIPDMVEPHGERFSDLGTSSDRGQGAPRAKASLQPVEEGAQEVERAHCGAEQSSAAQVPIAGTSGR